MVQRNGFEGITKEYILNDIEHCNFCDLPYILMELEEDEQNLQKPKE